MAEFFSLKGHCNSALIDKKKLEPDTGAFDWIEHDVWFLVVRALSLTDQALVLTHHEVRGPLPARPGVDPVGPAFTAGESDLTRHAMRGMLTGVALVLTWKKSTSVFKYDILEDLLTKTIKRS